MAFFFCLFIIILATCASILAVAMTINLVKPLL